MKAGFPHRLYLVTDEASCLGRDMIQVVEASVRGGVDLVQLREKNLGHDDFLSRALRLKEMLDRYGVPLIVNDSIAVALESSAAGIHVGNSDMPPVQVRKEWPGCKLLGYSIEYETQLNSDNALASDYLAISPVFSTPTKTNTVVEWKLEGVHRIRSLTDKPLVAIGGINPDNAGLIIKAGADCLAVVSAICSAADPERAAARLRTEIERSSGGI